MIEKIYNKYVTTLHLCILALRKVKLYHLFRMKRSKTLNIKYWINKLINS